MLMKTAAVALFALSSVSYVSAEWNESNAEEFLELWDYHPLTHDMVHIEYYEFDEQEVLELPEEAQIAREVAFAGNVSVMKEIDPLAFAFERSDEYNVLNRYEMSGVRRALFEDTDRMLGEEGEEVDGEVEEGDGRRLLRLCGRCKSARKYMKCLKNKCGSKKKTTSTSRRLLDDMYDAANKIRASRNLRGLKGPGGDNGGGKGTQDKEEDTLDRQQDQTEHKSERLARMEEKVADDWKMALIKDTVNWENKEAGYKHLAFELYSAEPDEDSCSPHEFLGECKTSVSACNKLYPGLNVTSCDASSTLGRYCQCDGDEACGCTKAAAQGGDGGRCTYKDFQTVDNCQNVGQCRGKYGGKITYDCKLNKGGVCYCGPKQVCGCMPEEPIE